MLQTLNFYTCVCFHGSKNLRSNLQIKFIKFTRLDVKLMLTLSQARPGLLRWKGLVHPGFWNFQQKRLFFSFEWEKRNFATFGPLPWKNVGEKVPEYPPPRGKILPTPMSLRWMSGVSINVRISGLNRFDLTHRETSKLPDKRACALTKCFVENCCKCSESVPFALKGQRLFTYRTVVSRKWNRKYEACSWSCTFVLRLWNVQRRLCRWRRENFRVQTSCV